MISFSGDEDQKLDAMPQRPSTVIQNYDKTSDVEERVLSSRENDEEMNIGSTATFKDFEGRESVELHNYESEEKDPIYREPAVLGAFFLILGKSHFRIIYV